MFSARSLCCSMLGLYRVDIQVSIVLSARHASCSQLGLYRVRARHVVCSQLGLYLFPSCVNMLLVKVLACYQIRLYSVLS